MRFIALFASLCLAAVAVCAERSPFGVTGRSMLLMDNGVKKELQITKEQQKAIQEAQKQVGQGGDAGSFDMSNPFAMMDPKLLPILNELQRKRLDELFIQANGGWALGDAKVAEALSLTDEQKDKVKEISSQGTHDLFERMRSVRGSGGMNAVKKLHNQVGDKLAALLTADQKSKLADMQGKLLKF